MGDMGAAAEKSKGLWYCVMEARVQQKLIKFLKEQGCYVIKTKPGPGTPVGCPDVIALHEGAWFAFEVKAHSNSPWRPLQKPTLEKLANWGFAYAVYSENVDDVIKMLKRMF